MFSVQFFHHLPLALGETIHHAPMFSHTCTELLQRWESPHNQGWANRSGNQAGALLVWTLRLDPARWHFFTWGFWLLFALSCPSDGLILRWVLWSTGHRGSSYTRNVYRLPAHKADAAEEETACASRGPDVDFLAPQQKHTTWTKCLCLSQMHMLKS